MGLSQYSAPSMTAVSLSEAKDHLRILTDDQDSLIGSYLDAACQNVENDLQRQLVTATWDLTMNCWTDRLPAGETKTIIEIPRPPLQSITSIKYIDVNGVEQTVSTSVYEAVTNVDPGWVRLKYDQTWPSHRAQKDAITVRFVAGYGLASAVPGGIKAMILLQVADFYENREMLNIGNIVNDLPTYGRLRDYYRVRSMP